MDVCLNPETKKKWYCLIDPSNSKHYSVATITATLLDKDNKEIGSPMNILKNADSCGACESKTITLSATGSTQALLLVPPDASGTTATESSGSGSGIEVGVEIPGKGTRFTYTEYMCAFYRWALNIGFGLTLLMFIYAGYRYMTAAGNDAVFTDTKDILTSAILGFLLLLLIKLILNILDVQMPDSCFEEPFKLL